MATITMERHIYFGTSAGFEGEEPIIPILRGEQPDASNPPTTSLPEPPEPTSPLTPLSSAPPPESPPAPCPVSYHRCDIPHVPRSHRSSYATCGLEEELA